MRNLFALIMFFSCGATAQTIHCDQKKYSIEIFDYDFSMAYTIRYNVSDDSLVIWKIGELVGEQDRCVVKQKINENQSGNVYNFLCSLDIMQLKDKYEKPFVNDGDQKLIRICFNNKMKTVEVNNIYQKEMANLFDVINQIVGAEFKISYKTR